MGSYISLGVGELELDWGKNFGFRDYSKLFLPKDLKHISYYYADDVVEQKPGYSCSLARVKPRLELLGYSLKMLKDIYQDHNSNYPNYLDKPDISFEVIVSIFSKISIADYKNKKEDGDYDLGEYVVENIFNNDTFRELQKHVKVKSKDIGSYFENFDPLFFLRLLMENPINLEMNLEWRTQDVIDGGWTNDKEVFVGVEEADRFLIVTEGSSDTSIIKKTLKFLKPDIIDFFTFIDMEENYPFTGTGNLFRFCQGLASIKIQNKVLVILDNDSEGILTLTKIRELSLPKNMRVMKLPSLPEFERVLTIGPSGETIDDINEKAVAIECFLDLSRSEPKIRWTNFIKDINAYQGSLENKDQFVKDFMKIRTKVEGYNFSKLEVLLEEIYQNCL